MTQEQVLKLEHLKVAEVRPGMFVHIHAEDDYRITSWKETDDIKEYSASICLYMPIYDTYAEEYRTISFEEHNALEERARIAIETEINDKQ